jgi:hypothetical protein
MHACILAHPVLDLLAERVLYPPTRMHYGMVCNPAASHQPRLRTCVSYRIALHRIEGRIWYNIFQSLRFYVSSRPVQVRLLHQNYDVPLFFLPSSTR